jgi:hypothetical protein
MQCDYFQKPAPLFVISNIRQINKQGNQLMNIPHSSKYTGKNRNSQSYGRQHNRRSQQTQAFQQSIVMQEPAENNSDGIGWLVALGLLMTWLFISGHFWWLAGLILIIAWAINKG